MSSRACESLLLVARTWFSTLIEAILRHHHYTILIGDDDVPRGKS